MSAVLLAAVVGAATLQLSASARDRERRSGERLLETRARADLLVRSIAGKPESYDDGKSKETILTENVDGSLLRVTVVWKRIGGVWRAASWTEVREWPMK